MLFEAANALGGQIRIGAVSWRRDLMGIVAWREAELRRLGVSVHTNSYMETADIAALGPDVVILATGGLPQIDLEQGSDLCHATWDVLTGQIPVSGAVLIFDGTGRHPGPLVAELAGDAGADVHYVSIDAQLAEELTYAERLNWKKRFLARGLQPTFEIRLVAVRRKENRLEATLVSQISREETRIVVDQIIVEQGSVPMDQVYFDLRGQSANDGVTELEALAKAAPQPRLRQTGFELHRIGDAVSSRNIHAAVLDAVRICSAL